MKPTRRASVSLVSETGFFLSAPECLESKVGFASLLIICGLLLIKFAVFGLSLSLPLLVGGSGGLVCKSVGKADLLSDHFDCKQSRKW